MSEKINVLGIFIDQHYVDDILVHIAEDWQNEGLSTYGVITMNLLMAAKENPDIKRFIEELDVSIIGEIEVLEAAGIEDEKMIKEVSSRKFFRRFFSRISEEGNSVFLLGEAKEQVDAFYKYLLDNYPRLIAAGSDYLDCDKADSTDRVINEINSLLPELVITCADSVEMKKFVLENRKKMNAKIWISLPLEYLAKNDMGLKTSWLSKLLKKTTFKKMVSTYNSKKENDS
jgi:N-acetylglucosaminyldiphosphoundecaprenol N-acetyl-beta-D-mannosaminyltransferase